MSIPRFCPFVSTTSASLSYLLLFPVPSLFPINLLLGAPAGALWQVLRRGRVHWFAWHHPRESTRRMSADPHSLGVVWQGYLLCTSMTTQVPFLGNVDITIVATQVKGGDTISAGTVGIGLGPVGVGACPCLQASSRFAPPLGKVGWLGGRWVPAGRLEGLHPTRHAPRAPPTSKLHYAAC